jgi:toxin YoeB
MRRIILEATAIEDIYYFGKNDPKLLKKISELLNAIAKEPFTGIGKPEPLRGNLQGFWSRRINEEHRLIYKVTSDSIAIASFRSHYNQ